jgi:hypothetical protein
MQPFADYNYHRSLITLEIGYCQIRGGVPGLDTDELRVAVAANLDGLHEDERMVGAWLRREIVAASSDLGDISTAIADLDRARERFDSSCAQLRQVLQSMPPQPHIQLPRVASLRSAG